MFHISTEIRLRSPLRGKAESDNAFISPGKPVSPDEATLLNTVQLQYTRQYNAQHGDALQTVTPGNCIMISCVTMCASCLAEMKQSALVTANR